MQLGELGPYTCPDCHGVLLALPAGPLRRFRCHTGHAFSADSLLAAVTSTSEDQLWSALRSLEENLLLLDHLGDHFAEANEPALAAVYYQHATNTQGQARLVRQALDQHALLTIERLQHQADAFHNSDRAERPEPH